MDTDQGRNLPTPLQTLLLRPVAEVDAEEVVYISPKAFLSLSFSRSKISMYLSL